MYGRKILSVYARDLKVGMKTRDNGLVVRIRNDVPPAYCIGPSLPNAGEWCCIGIRYKGRLGIHVVAPHDVIQLDRL